MDYNNSYFEFWFELELNIESILNESFNKPACVQASDLFVKCYAWKDDLK